MVFCLIPFFIIQSHVVRKNKQWKMYNQQKILSRGDKVKIDKSAGDGLEKCKKENEVNGMQGIVVRWSRHSSLTLLVKLDNSNKVVKVPVTWCVAVGETQQQKLIAAQKNERCLPCAICCHDCWHDAASKWNATTWSARDCCCDDACSGYAASSHLRRRRVATTAGLRCCLGGYGVVNDLNHRSNNILSFYVFICSYDSTADGIVASNSSNISKSANHHDDDC